MTQCAQFETVKLTNSHPQRSFLSAVFCFCYLSEKIIFPRKLGCNFHQICLTAAIVTTQVINGPRVLQEHINYEAAHYQHAVATKHLVSMEWFELERMTHDWCSAGPRGATWGYSQQCSLVLLLHTPLCHICFNRNEDQCQCMEKTFSLE